MSLKIAIGLGNTGLGYVNTRHNAGEIVLKQLSNEYGKSFTLNKYCNAYTTVVDVASQPLILAFANGFMNLSGQNINKILKFYKANISQVAVIYDDITLDVGRMKISKGGSSGGHNGIADIMGNCGNDFTRIRIGIGAKPYKTMDLADFVLAKLPQDDLTKIESVNIKECIYLLSTKGVEATQNVLNRK